MGFSGMGVPGRKAIGRMAGTAALGALCLAAAACRREPAPPRPAAPVTPTAPAAPAVVPPEPAVPLVPDVILERGRREVPGRVATPYLFFRDVAATNVTVCGMWDRWRTRHALARRDGLWVLDVRPLRLAAGRYEFKFITDGEWEPGANRLLEVGEQHWLERFPAAVSDARIETVDRIEVYLRQAPSAPDAVDVRLEPPVGVRSVKFNPGIDRRALAGFVASGDSVLFSFDDRVFRAGLTSNDTLCVAGTFNGWNPTAWRMEPAGNRVWERQVAGINVRSGAPEAQFKFVVNGSRWIGPRPDAPNVALDGQGNANFRLGPDYSSGGTLEIVTSAPLALSNAYTLVIGNLAARPVRYPLRPGAVLNTLRPLVPLGLALDRDTGRASVSFFAPRAAWVDLWVSARPHVPPLPAGQARGGLPMAWDGREGTWIAAWDGVAAVPYYGCRLDGPAGPGESFDPAAFVGDPYARAVVSERGPCIAIDPDAPNPWFGGWTDGDYRAPAHADVVIYEAHVRDLTMDPSSGVPAVLRGTFEGILATTNTDTGLTHLKALGVNMIELMPVQEFDNGVTNYGWGYSPEYFFAPESSYGREPAAGSQYHEFKRLVNELHRQGFGVILDVVFNHVGGVNALGRIDRRVYFRLDGDDGYRNDSGCGNDLRTESPALRRLIVDNVLYWIREHHVDGFRFDLAELVDMDTLRAVQEAARAANPRILLISEPWSLRGDHKRALRDTPWYAWNNEFTHPVRAFIKGDGRADEVTKAIAGSVDLWTRTPLQSINYFESHDDMALADELSTAPGRDGRLMNEADAARNRLAATVLFTSLGIPMLSEGQEFLRSKHGIRNTFDRGDAVNALRWTDRELPLAREALAYYRGLIRLRQSAAGASLRLEAAAPPGYFEWILPASGQLLGYRVNIRHERPGSAFVVLVNASPREAAFDVDLPAGRWRLVGDGRTLDPAGARVRPVPVKAGARNRLAVPGLTAYVLMDGN